MTDWILREGSKSQLPLPPERRTPRARRAHAGAHRRARASRPAWTRRAHRGEPARRGAGVGARREGAEAVPLPRARRGARTAAQVLPRARAGEGPAASCARRIRRARAPRATPSKRAVAAAVVQLDRARASSASAASATPRRTGRSASRRCASGTSRSPTAMRVFTLRRQAVDPAAAGRARTASSHVSSTRQLDSPGRATLPLPGRRALAQPHGARRERVSARHARRAVQRQGLSHVGRHAARRDGARRARARATRRPRRKRNVATAMRLVAAELGNTPAICRKSYVHPIVVARYLDEGETIRAARRATHATPTAYAHSPEERALIRFLDEHFPERRRRTRARAGGSTAGWPAASARLASPRRVHRASSPREPHPADSRAADAAPPPRSPSTRSARARRPLVAPSLAAAADAARGVHLRRHDDHQGQPAAARMGVARARLGRAVLADDGRRRLRALSPVARRACSPRCGTSAGGAAWPFHLYALALHALVAVAVWWMLRRGVGAFAAAVGALWFATHPLHVEAVASAANTAELLVVRMHDRADVAAARARPTLVRCAAPAREWRIALGVAVLTAAAVLSKESGLLALPIAALTAWGWRASDTTRASADTVRDRRRLWLAGGAALAVALLARAVVLGAPGRARVDRRARPRRARAGASGSWRCCRSGRASRR